MTRQDAQEMKETAVILVVALVAIAFMWAVWVLGSAIVEHGLISDAYDYMYHIAHREYIMWRMHWLVWTR